MCLAKHVKEFLQACGVGWIVVIVPLFIADAHIFEIERFWMSHLCSDSAPLCVCCAISKFYQVESIVDVCVETVERNMHAWSFWMTVLELAAESAAEYWQRLAAEVFTKEEELVEAESV